jgi:hypothetical protein
MPTRTTAAAADPPASAGDEPKGDVRRLGEGPPASLNSQFEAIGRAMGMAAENAVAEQQRVRQEASAATARSVQALYALDFAAMLRPPAPASTTEKDT